MATRRKLVRSEEEQIAEQTRHAELDAVLWRLAQEGFASWSGGKPKGSKHPAKLTPGPPISDYIIQDRERLRN